REEEARQAVARERARIARELHDVIAHSVGLITVQAGAANLVFGENPEAALSSMSSIERTGRLALGELRRLLGVLRTEDEGEDLRPQPSLDRLDELVAEVEEAGVLRSRSRVISETCRLPSGSLPTGSCRRVSPT
ncbi:MAG: sensor histidine kinase, partial [Actinomycetota bacterium]